MSIGENALRAILWLTFVLATAAAAAATADAVFKCNFSFHSTKKRNNFIQVNVKSFVTGKTN